MVIIWMIFTLMILIQNNGLLFNKVVKFLNQDQIIQCVLLRILFMFKVVEEQIKVVLAIYFNINKINGRNYK